MLHYGPADNQKFAIRISPETYDLIEFLSAGYHDELMRSGTYDNQYFTYTISRRHKQSISTRKIETEDDLKKPWNKLNPEDRRIAFVTV